jgi:hypothetical protein
MASWTTSDLELPFLFSNWKHKNSVLFKCSANHTHIPMANCTAKKGGKKKQYICSPYYIFHIQFILVSNGVSSCMKMDLPILSYLLSALRLKYIAHWQTRDLWQVSRYTASVCRYLHGLNYRELTGHVNRKTRDKFCWSIIIILEGFEHAFVLIWRNLNMH